MEMSSFNENVEREKESGGLGLYYCCWDDN